MSTKKLAGFSLACVIGALVVVLSSGCAANKIKPVVDAVTQDIKKDVVAEIISNYSAQQPPVPVVSPSHPYIVIKGNTLWGIAGKELKNSFKWPVIYKRNRDRIDDPNFITEGLLINIPEQYSQAQADEAILMAQQAEWPIKNHR